MKGMRFQKSTTFVVTSRALGLGLFLVFGVLLPALAGANIEDRVVRSKEDAERLKGFDDHFAGQKKRDAERLKGVNAYKKRVADEERERREATADFIKNRKKKENLDREATPEYREDLRRREKKIANDEKLRSIFVSDRDRRWARESRSISLSEARELGVPENRPRVEIAKRKPPTGKAGAGGSGGSSGYNGGGNLPEPDFPPPDFGPPPPPAPEFFEPEFPPPPTTGFPPPPGFEGGEFPPPPGFEGGDTSFPFEDGGAEF